MDILALFLNHTLGANTGQHPGLPEGLWSMKAFTPCTAVPNKWEVVGLIGIFKVCFANENVSW